MKAHDPASRAAHSKSDIRFQDRARDLQCGLSWIVWPMLIEEFLRWLMLCARK
jgi:hypothetical protein